MKKELVAASLLAVAFAAGLGTLSYGLFAEAPPARNLEAAIDVYTSKGGIGNNVAAGTFAPGDTIPVNAYLTVGGAQFNDSQVTFTVKKPDGSETVETALTNESGVAEIPLSFLLAEGHQIGTWQILAHASVNNKAVDDAMTLQCRSNDVRIDILSKKHGVVSTSFLPTNEVFLEARLFYKNASIPDTPVYFEVKTPYNMDFLSPTNKTVLTDGLGTANVTFQIPWPSDSVLGTWTASVTSQVYEQAVNATSHFDCIILQPKIDVYTQKGGQGQNMAGGDFALNESLLLYGEVRDELNQTVPNRNVGFEIRFFNTTSVLYADLTDMTNTSGIASASTRIPPPIEYAGSWAVYASVYYNDKRLIDTYAFIVEPFTVE